MRRYKWQAGWYRLTMPPSTYYGRESSVVTWLGPLQASKVAKTMRWLAYDVQEISWQDDQSRPKPASTLAGLVWQQIFAKGAQ